jgi:hypothetical protein
VRLLQHTLSVQLIQVTANGVLRHIEHLRKHKHFHAPSLPEYLQKPRAALLGEAWRIGISGARVGYWRSHASSLGNPAMEIGRRCTLALLLLYARYYANTLDIARPWRQTNVYAPLEVPSARGHCGRLLPQRVWLRHLGVAYPCGETGFESQ